MKAYSPVMYYGSKNKLARQIIEQMTPHNNYVEPFCGSAAVLLAKDPAHVESINDIDSELVTFFRVLRDHPTRLKRALSLTPYAEDERKAAYAGQPKNDIDQARRFLVRSRMSFSGIIHPKRGFSSSGPGRSKPQSFMGVVDGLHAVAERLRHVEIENTDAMSYIDRWNAQDTTLYVDPPYLASTRGSKREYLHDANDDEFHCLLLKRLIAFRGEVVLSGYHNALYDEMIGRRRGWSSVSFDVRTSASRTRSDAISNRTEVLWIKRRAKRAG